MKTKNIIVIIAMVLISLNFTGCIGVNGNFKRVRNTILDNLDGKYHRDIEFSVGAAGLALAGTFVSFADTDVDYADDIIRQVNRVQVGIYEKVDNADEKPDMKLLQEISKLLEDTGWEYIVRTCDHNQMTAVFIRSAETEQISHLFVIALDDNQLVLTEVRGDLDKVVEIAIREQGLKFNIADNM